jgi:hypothetical protein
MAVVNMKALKEWAKRSPTGRTESAPEVQRIPAPLTPEERELVDAIKYFFKTRSRDHE